MSSTAIRRLDLTTGAQTTVDDGNGAVQVAIGALDGAGPSVVALDATGALRVYRAVGSDSYAAEVLPDVGAKAALSLADMDGDGDRDIVRTGAATGWHQSR